ncbi:MAG: heme-binding domain-containing protein [Solirubrobacterales bacterium]|nr:heme-binding domain-containing protein [Solirubrobacterales bacterium]
MGILGLIALFLLIQLVPYGHAHDNPPVTQAVKWDSPRTQQLFEDACGACHSNLTNWPADSYVAPTSWLVQHDVEEARGILNVSEWDKPQPGAGEAAEAVTGGEMPPLQYKLMHSSSRLSDSEKQDLADGLTRTFQLDPPGP